MRTIFKESALGILPKSAINLQGLKVKASLFVARFVRAEKALPLRATVPPLTTASSVGMTVLLW
jgi:hypothetical protein